MIAVHIWGGSNVSLSGSWDSWASYFLSILILLEILTLPLHPHFLLASLLPPPPPPHTYTHIYTHRVCLVHTHTYACMHSRHSHSLSPSLTHTFTQIYGACRLERVCERVRACVRVCLRACWGGYRVCTRLGNTCEEKEGDGRMTTRECKRRREKRRRGDLDRGKGKRDGWRPLMQHGG